MQLTFNVQNQIITRTDNFQPVAKSQNYLRASFTFSDDWGNDDKIAIFHVGNDNYEMILDSENECLVPWEALVVARNMYVSVYSGDRITASEALVKILPTGYTERVSATEDPSIDVYSSLLSRINSIDEDIVNQVDVALTEAKESGEFKGDKGDKGDTGPTGPQGDAGADGDDGFSPTVTVIDITGGHRVTITDASGAHTFDVMDGQSGGGGTGDYDELTNKPQIAGVTLSGNKSLADLGIASASDIPTVPVQSVNGKTGAVVLNASDVGAGTYSKPSGGIPKTDLASAIQTSLGLADTALQTAPVASVNGQTGAVTLTIPSTASDVNAIAAPSSPASGAFLVWNGSAWVAQTLATWQGGAY